tara:strand:+ start:1695 stop:2210 length:516 start_codon:yes stop_codon:yes gene_type:complete
MGEDLEKQPCPICKKKTLELREEETEVPYFGKMFLFSMQCEECKYYKADMEAVETQEPCKWTFEVDGEEDLKVRVIKSAQATVKIPHIASITPGPASNGYITNVEGIINRIKHQIESARDAEEDNSAKKKAKNMLKKLQKVVWGKEKLKLILEDPSGNSAIVSDKAEKKKL